MTSSPFTIRRLGYDERKGLDVWPNKARMAVLTYTCPEEWDWSRKEPLIPNGALILPAEKTPSLSTRTAVGYGFNIGLRRLRDIAKRQGVRLTLATTGNAAERHPDVLQELASLGHEFAAHGYSEGMPPIFLSRDEQLEDIDRTVAAIQVATGQSPRGWWSPGGLCNVDTVELLAERRFLYHGDLQDDELPYFVDTGGHALVQIPFNMTGAVNDYFMFINQRRPPEDHLGYLTSTFDAYYRQAEETPLYLIWGTHPFIIGRPDTAYVFERFIEHVRRYDDVWLATYSEVGEWWHKRFATHKFAAGG